MESLNGLKGEFKGLPKSQAEKRAASFLRLWSLLQALGQSKTNEHRITTRMYSIR